jgi:hypothetical protein
MLADTPWPLHLVFFIYSADQPSLDVSPEHVPVFVFFHRTGDKCVLNFKPCGLFGKELHRVEGYIQDKK